MKFLSLIAVLLLGSNAFADQYNGTCGETIKIAAAAELGSVMTAQGKITLRYQGMNEVNNPSGNITVDFTSVGEDGLTNYHSALVEVNLGTCKVSKVAIHAG